MEFREGQMVRVSTTAPVPEYARGKLAVITEVLKFPKGTQYELTMMALKLWLRESDIQVGPEDAVH